jgi:multiple sugar transport system permease protein
MGSVWTLGRGRLPRLSSVAIFLVLAGYLLLVLFPIYWIIVSSFKIPVDTLAVPPIWFFRPTLDAYLNVFAVNNYLRFFLNSAIVAVGTVGIALFCGSLAAYALDRMPFRFSGLVSYGLLTTRMIFPIVYAIPLFNLMRHANLLETRTGLIIAYTTFSLPYAVWIMQGFFNGIPVELDEAGMIDGCSRFSAFWRVILPVAGPGLAAASIFIFMLAWNEFLFALILAGGGTAKTLPVAAAQLIGQREIQWNELCAVATVTIVPMVFFFILFQKHLIKGMIAGAVK